MIAICPQMFNPQSCVRNVLQESEYAEAQKNTNVSAITDNYSSHRYNVRSRYDLVRTLGKGTYGKVKLAIERGTGRKFAVKTIRKDRVKEKNDMKHIRREMKIMSSLRHPNIIQIHEVFENQDKIVIVMEYALKGELYEYLAEKNVTSELEACVFFKQIVSAVKYCHERGVVHRDLKLENILLGENYEIKIADFGLANLFRSDQLLQTFCGSPLYASPEIVNGIKYVGPEVDSWSLGVLLYALVYGMMPFDGSDYKTLTWQISHAEYLKQNKYPDADDLISQMLTVDPTVRANIHQIAAHRWLHGKAIQSCMLPMALTPPPVLPETNQVLDSNANYLNQKSEAVISEVSLSNIENIAPSVNSCLVQTVVITTAQQLVTQSTATNYQSPPKGILKRNDISQTADVAEGIVESVPLTQPQNMASGGVVWSPDITVPNMTHENPGNPLLKDVACGLQAKDSLKLKAKPLGASGKRRILKSKRDRESGYYSSPERTPVDMQSVPIGSAFTFTPPVIKPQLSTSITPHLRPRQSIHRNNETLFPVPQHYCSPSNCSYILPLQGSTSPIPIIEGQPMTFIPKYVNPTTGVSNMYSPNLAVPYAFASLGGGVSTSCSNQRPISTYSDSSILSSDSFELCTFDSPLSSSLAVTTPINSTFDTHVNINQSPNQFLVSGVRPTILPIAVPPPPPLSAPPGTGCMSPPCSSTSEPSGCLTPTSAKLSHDLRRILGPRRRKSKPSIHGDNSHRHSAPPSSISDEQTDQLNEMMRQLNIDLEKAYKKALDMGVSFTTAEV